MTPRTEISSRMETCSEGCSSSSFSAAANRHARTLRSAPSSIVNRGHVECGAHWRTHWHILISGHAINSSTDTSLLAFGGKFWGDGCLPSRLHFRHCRKYRLKEKLTMTGSMVATSRTTGTLVGNWLITTRNVCQKKTCCTQLRVTDNDGCREWMSFLRDHGLE